MFFVRQWRNTMHPFWLWVAMAMELSRGIALNLYSYFCCHGLQLLRGCLVCDFKQPFSVFKQHFTHFNTLFHPHVFPQIFLNNNFKFLNTQTKRALNCKEVSSELFYLFSAISLIFDLDQNRCFYC